MKTTSIGRFFALLLTLAAFPFFFTCCCDPSQLPNQTWVLEKYGPASNLNTVIAGPGHEPELTMDAGNHFTGHDGCNAIFGFYDAGKNCRIRFDSISTTLILCQEDVMNQANAVATLLKKVNKFEVTDTRLKLCAPGDELLEYRKK